MQVAAGLEIVSGDLLILIVASVQHVFQVELHTLTVVKFILRPMDGKGGSHREHGFFAIFIFCVILVSSESPEWLVRDLSHILLNLG